MSQPKKGDVVKVHYTGKFNDGTVFDSSRDQEPLQFTIGEGQIIPGFEKAVMDLEAGETVSVEIPPADAYGQYNKDLVQKVPKNQLPQDLEPKVGQQLEAVQDNGARIPLRISEVNEEDVVVDANHPLAGKDLNFDIELVEIL
ncbi:MAG: peptidylprolyl isomerase [Calditrichia bacterium]